MSHTLTGSAELGNWTLLSEQPQQNIPPLCVKITFKGHIFHYAASIISIVYRWFNNMLLDRHGITHSYFKFYALVFHTESKTWQFISDNVLICNIFTSQINGAHSWYISHVYLIPEMQLNVHCCTFRCSIHRGNLSTSNKHTILLSKSLIWL